MKPERIQRKRTKGWRMPENTIYVGRPTKWGNPFVGDDVVKWYRKDWELTIQLRMGTDRCAKLVDDLHELRGKNLACWCRLDQECHADVLLELANREVT